jgi:hypothetical protein
MVFPILAVKSRHRYFFDCSRIQAAHVNAVTVRMRSRHIERFDATCLTKHVLCHTGVEGVDRKRFRTLDESEAGFRHDQMKKPAFTTDRTVAFDRFDRSRRFDLESHTAAMAATAVFNQVSFSFLERAQLRRRFHLFVVLTAAGGAVAFGAMIEDFLGRRNVGGLALPGFQCRIL